MITDRDLKYLEQYKQKKVLGCKKCHGTDYFCSCYLLYRLEIKKIKANISQKYRSITLADIDHPDVQKPKKVIEEYIQNIDSHLQNGTGLYLYGTPGLGKTLLSSIVLIEVLKKGYSGYFTDLSQCIAMLLEGWGDEDKKKEFIETLLEKDFLVIDDIGREYQSASKLHETAFDTVFRERANRMLPIIITSNKQQAEMELEYGNRIISLFYEHLIPVEFKGTDFRKGILKKRMK